MSNQVWQMKQILIETLWIITEIYDKIKNKDIKCLQICNKRINARTVFHLI